MKKKTKIQENKRKSTVIRTIQIVGMIVIPLLLFYLEACFTYHPFERTRWRAQILNLVILEALFWVLFMLIGRARWALQIETLFVLICGVANYYVISFRGNPIVPWDFMSLGTAASVAGEYSYKLGGKQVLLILIFIALLVAEYFIDIRISRKKWVARLVAGVLSLAIICGITVVISDDEKVTKLQLYPFLFTPNVMYERNGFAVTFLMDLRYLRVDKPAGYHANTVTELLDEYSGEDWGATEGTDSGQKLPNVIVVMDEAFSDVGILGPVNVDQDPLPFLHSLQEGAENTISGQLHVSVKGGNTANTEFEFLTGSTMAFLPAGSIPYQQYITGEQPSLASYLKTLGYTTAAAHPYYASGWNRNIVYPSMGFESFLDKNDYSTAHLIRGYVDDMSCVDKIIEQYENKELDQPLFSFTVTMQNHSPYTDGYQLVDGNLSVDGDTRSALALYESLMRESDKALEAMITYFEKQEEPTVIVFFGDHQPTDSVVSSIQRYGSDSMSEQELEAVRYEVPYIIWANYDIEEAQDRDSSPNYLAAQMCEAAGIPLADYQEFLLDIAKDYPVISTQKSVNSQGEVMDDLTRETRLVDYQKLQYYWLFDSDK